MYKYYNANPRGRHVNDCTVRAISLATGRSWEETYARLSKFACSQCTMPDDVKYIDNFLEKHFTKVCGCKNNIKITVGEFVSIHPTGSYLITMRGHITCVRNGVIYDTFDPSDRYVWGAYLIEEGE